MKSKLLCYWLMVWLLCFPLSALADKTLPPPVSFDGLTLIKHSKSSIVYRKEPLDLKRYNKLILLPSQVAFKKDWKRDYNRKQVSITARVKDRDIERMKGEVAKLFDQVFQEELSEVKHFSLTSTADDKTLVLKPALVNLDVNAPDVKTAHRHRTYVQVAGEGTLYLEVYDAVSGEILARVLDAKATRDNGFFQWANRVSNRADAKALLRQWANKLKLKLDEIHEP